MQRNVSAEIKYNIYNNVLIRMTLPEFKNQVISVTLE